MITLQAGKPYTVKVTVTNVSTKADQPVAATMDIALAAVVSSLPIGGGRLTYNFAARETRSFDFAIDVPSTASGAGAIAAHLLDPNGNLVNSGGVDVIVAKTPVTDLEVQSLNTRWEDKLTWQGIRSSNSWPANKQMIIVIGIKNTGNVATEFKVVGTQIGVPCPAVSLIPGQSGLLELSPFYAVAGTYTWQFYARNLDVEWAEKVDEVTFDVVVY